VSDMKIRICRRRYYKN